MKYNQDYQNLLMAYQDLAHHYNDVINTLKKIVELPDYCGHGCCGCINSAIVLAQNELDNFIK
jgi:hypothetical protein